MLVMRWDFIPHPPPYFVTVEVCATCAFTTIEGAIEQANDNTTIMVYSGIYAGVPINVTRQIVLWYNHGF